MLINISSLVALDASQEDALWTDFALLYNDDSGCSPKDRDAIASFMIERCAVVIDKSDELLGIVRVEARHGHERYIWISLAKNVDETCIADENASVLNEMINS